MNYKPDILINIFHDIKNQKTYLMNFTSKKIYFYPDELKDKRKKSRKRGIIEIVIGILLFTVPLYANPWYINNPSRGLIATVISLGLLGSTMIGMVSFLITRKFLNKQAITEEEYLKLHPKLGVVRDIMEVERVVDRVLVKSKVRIIAIVLFIVGAIACFILFYRTYIINYVFIAFALVLLTFEMSSKLKEALFVIKVVQERKVKEE